MTRICSLSPRYIATGAALCSAIVAIAGWRSAAPTATATERAESIVILRNELASNPGRAGRDLFRATTFGEGPLAGVLCDRCPSGVAVTTVAQRDAVIKRIEREHPDFFASLAHAVAEHDPLAVRSALGEGQILLIASAEAEHLMPNTSKTVLPVQYDWQTDAPALLWNYGARRTETGLGADIIAGRLVELFR